MKAQIQAKQKRKIEKKDRKKLHTIECKAEVKNRANSWWIALAE